MAYFDRLIKKYTGLDSLAFLLILSIVFIIICALFIRSNEKYEPVGWDLEPEEWKKLFHIQAKKRKCQKKNEKECRRVLETLFEAPFPSIRPDWLKYPKTKRNLEIDCANMDLGILLLIVTGKRSFK